MKNQLFCGDSEQVLKGLPDQTFDACVCDPPYGLGTKEPTGAEIDAYLAGQAGIDTGGDFMGKAWDIPRVGLWREVYRTMRDGGVLMAFAGTRTLDLMAAGIEAAGFRYVGTLAWMHGQGFPKSLNIGKALDKMNAESDRPQKFTSWLRGQGVTVEMMRPLLEPMAANKATAQAMAQHYVSEGQQPRIPTKEVWEVLRPICGDVPAWVDELVERVEAQRAVVGRGPNYGHQRSATGFGFADGFDLTAPATDEAKRWDGWGTALKPSWEPVLVFSRGPTSWQMPGVPFLYCAKAAKAEKNLDGEVENNHVTVKPVQLMEWLVSMAAPKGGLVLEPFLGSGTTAVACAEQGRSYVGIERDPEYFKMASQRVGIVKGRADEVAGQRSLFDMIFELDGE